MIANDGVIKLHVNGKEVSGVSKCTPRKGYLALESEGVECHFKNIKIKELPSTNPKPEEIAKVAEGHVSLFNGVDLKGWKTEKDAWKVSGGRLIATGKAELVSEKKYLSREIVFDYKIPAKAEKPEIRVSYDGSPIANVPVINRSSGKWERDGYQLVVVEGTVAKLAPIVFKATEGVEIMNVFVRELKEKK